MVCCYKKMVTVLQLINILRFTKFTTSVASRLFLGIYIHRKLIKLYFYILRTHY